VTADDRSGAWAKGVPVPPRPARRPLQTIRPVAGLPSLSLRETWQFRGLLATFAGRELRVRYRQTALGVAWFVLQPLLMAAAFAFVFGAVARMPAERAPRLLFTFAGVLPWNLFSYIVTRGSQTMVWNAGLISKVFFPRELLPLSLVLTGLVDLGVAFGLLVLVAGTSGTVPTSAIVFLPLWLILLCLLSSGLALLTAALTVWYRDLQIVVQVAIQLLLYVSPIAYSVDNIPARFRLVVQLNPLTPLLEGFRWSILGGGQTPAWQVGYAVVVSVGVFFAGLAVFRNLERRFADVV
jgi:lipopolysaccharide transport system permease protein